MANTPESERRSSSSKAENGASALEWERVALEKQRQEADARFRQRELELQQAELDLRRQESARKQWQNPLFIGLLAAIVGIVGNIVVSMINGVLERQKLEQQALQADLRHRLEQQLAAQESEFELIRQAFAKTDRDQYFRHFLDLIELGFVRDPDGNLRAWLASKMGSADPGSAVTVTGPAIARPTGVMPLASISVIGDLDLAPLLTSAITKVLAEDGRSDFVAPSLLLQPGPDDGESVAAAVPQLLYDTSKRRYRHQICGPDPNACFKAIVIGSIRMDGAILALSAKHGVTERDRRSVDLARAVGVPALVVFIDTDGESGHDPAALERDARQLLQDNGFPGSNVPVIHGSAQAALDDNSDNSIGELLDVVDATIPQPIAAKDLPFLLPVEDIFSISGRGTVVTGTVDRGELSVGDQVEIVGLTETRTVTATGIEMFRKLLDFGQAGDNIGVLLAGAGRDDLQRGQVLAKPGSITPQTRFQAVAYLLSEEEGGRRTPFFSNHRPTFYFRTADITGVIELPQDDATALPGETIEMTVELIAPVALEEGLRFAIREGGRTVGAGVVSRILP